MRRIFGSYNIQSSPISQADFHNEPLEFQEVDGLSIPLKGQFTLVNCQRGIASMYVSIPGSTPLYYHADNSRIYWHEQQLAIPSPSYRIEAGELVTWTPFEIFTQKVEDLPCPEIEEPTTLENAIATYQNLILQAVKRLLPTNGKVALSQSGGLDSTLIAWALHQLEIDFIPLTVCTNQQDLDILAASNLLSNWGIKPIPIVVTRVAVSELIDEALLALEYTSSMNVRMAIGNILIARKCQELGVDTIFTGDGQDAIHGKGNFTVASLYLYDKGTEAQKWRDARRWGSIARGMLKKFASTFRRYGINVRHPYYDPDLLKWVYAQPLEILPVARDKPFVRQVANSALPPGIWSQKRHSIGYGSGSGMSLRGTVFADNPLIEQSYLNQRLNYLKSQGWKAIAKYHATN